MTRARAMVAVVAVISPACAPIWTTTTHVRYRDPTRLQIVPATDAHDLTGEVVGGGRAESPDGSGGDYTAQAIRMPPPGGPGLRWETQLLLSLGVEEPVLPPRDDGMGFDVSDDDQRVRLDESVRAQLASPTLRVPVCAGIGPYFEVHVMGKMRSSHQAGFAGAIETPCLDPPERLPLRFALETPWSNVREVRITKTHESMDSLFWGLLPLAIGLTALGGIGIAVAAEGPSGARGAAGGMIVSGFAFGAVIWGGVLSSIPSMRAKDVTTVVYESPAR